MKLSEWILDLCEYILGCEDGMWCEFPVSSGDRDKAEELIELVKELKELGRLD